MRNEVKRVLPLVALWALSAAPLVAAPPQQRTPARYFVFELAADDEMSLIYSQDVLIAAALETEDLTRPARDHWSRKPALHGRDRVVVTVIGLNGAPLFRTTVDVARDVHVEAPGPGGEFFRRDVRLDRPAFAVRVPRIGRQVEVFTKRTGATKRFSAIPEGTRASALKSGSEFVEMTGSPGNRLDVLILGDGYTAAETSKFGVDANLLASDFLSITPYAEYANFVNVSSHFVASAESGADHPPCSDPYEQPDPAENTFVNTAFDATFCTSGIQRLLTVNASKVLAAAAAVPDWDFLIVIVNDNLYGGSGGFLAVVSLSDLSVGVLQHEWAHTFTGLADEYTTPYPGYPGCNDLSGPDCEPNVTTQTIRQSIKWYPWIAPETPVPTPSTIANAIGLFEGARYQTTGYYRPKLTCLMRSTDAPFCEICRQEYVLALRRGWGGVPATGIDVIEPGTEVPATSTVTGRVGEPSAFGATVLQPIGGPDLLIRWTVDGVLQPSTTSAMTFTPSVAGDHTVVLRAMDPTTFVDADMGASALESSRMWTLVAEMSAPANFVATAGATRVDLSWAPAIGASTYEIARSTGGTFEVIASTASTTYADTAVERGHAYLYMIRSVGGTGAKSPFSSPDLATVFSASDDPLGPNTVVKAVHMTELRMAIDAARAVSGLSTVTYTHSPAPGVVIRALDVQEMRAAIDQTRTAIGIGIYPFADPGLTPGSTIIRREHVEQLRAAIR